MSRAGLDIFMKKLKKTTEIRKFAMLKEKNYAFPLTFYTNVKTKGKRVGG